MKTCTKCSVAKDLSEFPNDKKSKDGHSGRCKACGSAAEKVRREADPEKYRERSLRARSKRRAANVAYAAEWKKRNPEKVKLSTKKSNDKNKEKNAQWRADNQDWVKNNALERTYGITLEQYSEMLAKQNHNCAICKQPERTVYLGKLKALAVDHDHETGQVRGLLCDPCNKALGLIRENSMTALSLLNYIEDHRGAA